VTWVKAIGHFQMHCTCLMGKSGTVMRLKYLSVIPLVKLVQLQKFTVE